MKSNTRNILVAPFFCRMKIKGFLPLLLKYLYEVRPLGSFLNMFIDRYNSKNQLIYLFKSLPLIVSFQTDTDNYHILFTKERATFTIGINNELLPVVNIVASNEVIRELLLGNRKLRKLVSTHELTVKAPFRTILLLESVFYLTSKGYESVSKSEDLVNAR